MSSLSVTDLHDITLESDEVIRVMVVRDDLSPLAGAPILTGYESAATHETTESALDFIDTLYEKGEDALDDLTLPADKFRVKPRRDTITN